MSDTIVQNKNRNPLGALRQERDRFVALAFSSADILIELDTEGEIIFAAGSTEALLGMGQNDLVGRPFITIVSVRDRAMVEEALAIARTGTRLNGLVLHMDGVLGTTPPMMLLGYRLQEMEGHYFLGLRLGAEDAGAFAAPGREGLMESGLPDARSFARLAGEKLKELIYEDAECELTMMQLVGIEELREGLDNESRKNLNEAIGGALRAGAVGGELAGELDATNYGLIHRQELDVEALSARLAQIASNADPENTGVQIGRTTVGLDVEAIRGGEAAKALGYIFTQFVQSDTDAFSIANLSEGLASMVDATVQRITEFRTVMNNSAFAVAFQPIVDLRTRRPHHFEALARFKLPSSNNKSPYETITFAEQAGLICDFDLAMCAKVFEWLDQAGLQGHRYKVAVNISGSSIGTPIFVSALHRLLEQYRGHRDSILFEVTESAKIQDLGKVNAALQSFRKAGHKVCLDDFGAGAAAFRYLRDLQVDVVKIDGAYVKGALKTAKGVAFLKAMAGLCNDLGIETVAEMVEEEKYVPFLRDCGVDFGQGYLFGRPSFDITDFEAPSGHGLDRKLLGVG